MKYIKEDIVNLLKEYKSNEGKIFEIDLKLDNYRKDLELAGTVYEDTEDNTIESMQLSGQSYDIIHSNTNKKSDKLFSTSINYKSEVNHINKKDRTYLENQIVKLEDEREELNKKVARVKNWLDKVEYEKQCILKEFYINNKGKNWNKAVKEYGQYENVKELQERQLRTKCNEAIEDILKIVNF